MGVKTMKATKKKIGGKKLSWYLGEAQRVFNRYIREVRDKDEPCIACGGYHESYDAGHYVPVGHGKGSFLRLHEWNVNKEGKSCNAFDEFHLIGYRKRLIEKIGVEAVDWLEQNRNTIKKWTRDELIEIINTYKTK